MNNDRDKELASILENAGIEHNIDKNAYNPISTVYGHTIMFVGGNVIRICANYARLFYKREPKRQLCTAEEINELDEINDKFRTISSKTKPSYMKKMFEYNLSVMLEWEKICDMLVKAEEERLKKFIELPDKLSQIGYKCSVGFTHNPESYILVSNSIITFKIDRMFKMTILSTTLKGSAFLNFFADKKQIDFDL